ncbi:hypothetical protein V5F59_10130 [Xanthobacter autotrophicus DSM 431]|uniref:hypothetical protein n=1 Tax=Xanthobacter nonsaccharivorans TaxID=3119912 RepID=UPI0037274257
MSAGDERLVVALEARIRDFEKNFEKAQRTANQRFSAIEKRAQSNAAAMKATFAAAGQSAEALFASLGGVGILGAGGLAGIVSTVRGVAGSVADLAGEAQKAGVAFEPFQELKYAAQQSRVGVDALTDGLKEMNLRADEFIRTGAGSGEEAFKRLGYSVADLKKKLTDPAALFEEIIDKMKGFNKAAQIRIADEIFGGTGGEQFVRFMEQGVGSISRARQRARELGLVLSDDVGKQAAAITKHFDELAARIEIGLKSGVLQAASAMETYKGEILAVATALGALALGARLGPLTASLASAAAGVVAAGVQMTRLNATILAVAAAQRVAALAGAGLSAALGLLGGPAGIAIAALVGGIALLAMRQDQAKVTAEGHKQAVADLDKAIADVKGKVPGAEATLKALADQHVENAKKALADAQAEYEYSKAVAARQNLGGWAGKYGAKAPADNTGEMAAAAEANLKRVEEAQKRLDELEAKRREGESTAPPKSADFALLGKGDEIMKSSQERVRSLEVERNALTMTVQAAAEYTFMMEAEAQARQANIKLTPQQKAQLEDLARKYGEVTAQIEKTKDAQEQLNEIKGMVGSFFSDLRSGLENGKSAADSFSDALKNLMNRILDMVQQKLLDQLFKMIWTSGLSEGGTVGSTTGSNYVKAASGGFIAGAGTSTSDSIPAMLSDGEFVVNAKQAKKFAPLLAALNSGRIPHFAEGGAVGGGMAGALMGGLAVNVFNEVGADVQAQPRRTAGGGVSLDILVGRAVNKHLAGGGADDPMRRYGVRPTLNRKG